VPKPIRTVAEGWTRTPTEKRDRGHPRAGHCPARTASAPGPGPLRTLGQGSTRAALLIPDFRGLGLASGRLAMSHELRGNAITWSLSKALLLFRPLPTATRALHPVIWLLAPAPEILVKGFARRPPPSVAPSETAYPIPKNTLRITEMPARL